MTATFATIILLLLSIVFAQNSIVSDGTTLYAVTPNTLYKYNLADLAPQCSTPLQQTVSTTYRFIPAGRYLFSYENTMSAKIVLIRIDTLTGEKKILFDKENQGVRQICGADHNYIYFIYASDIANDNGELGSPFYLRRQSINGTGHDDLRLPSGLANNFAWSPANNAIFILIERFGCQGQSTSMKPYTCDQIVQKIDLVKFKLESKYRIAGDGSQAFIAPQDQLIVKMENNLYYFNIDKIGNSQYVKNVTIQADSLLVTFLHDVKYPNDVNIGYRTNYQGSAGRAKADDFMWIKYDHNGNKISQSLIANSSMVSSSGTGAFNFDVANNIVFFLRLMQVGTNTVDLLGVSTFINGTTVEKSLNMPQCDGQVSAGRPSSCAGVDVSGPNIASPARTQRSVVCSGNGSCDGNICKCKEGYYGRECENVSSKQPSETTNISGSNNARVTTNSASKAVITGTVMSVFITVLFY